MNQKFKFTRVYGEGCTRPVYGNLSLKMWPCMVPHVHAWMVHVFVYHILFVARSWQSCRANTDFNGEYEVKTLAVLSAFCLVARTNTTVFWWILKCFSHRVLDGLWRSAVFSCAHLQRNQPCDGTAEMPHLTLGWSSYNARWDTEVISATVGFMLNISRIKIGWHWMVENTWT